MSTTLEDKNKVADDAASKMVVPLNSKGQPMFDQESINWLGADDMKDLQAVSERIKGQKNHEAEMKIAEVFCGLMDGFQKRLSTVEENSIQKGASDEWEALTKEALVTKYTDTATDSQQKASIRKHLIENMGHSPEIVDLQLGRSKYGQLVTRPTDASNPNHREVEQLQKSHDMFNIWIAMKGLLAPQGNEILTNGAAIEQAARTWSEKGMPNGAEILKGVGESHATTSTNNGLEWVNLIMSNQLLSDLQSRLVVYNLFREYTMGAKEVRFPMLADRGLAFRQAEGTTPSQLLQVLGTAVSQKTDRGIWIAEKLSALQECSAEFIEDVNVPAMSLYRADILDKIVRAIESAIVNGSDQLNDHDNAGADGSRWWANSATTTAFQKSYGATDVRNSWNGLRKLAPAACRIDAGNAKPTIALLRSMRTSMGLYAQDNKKLAYLMSFVSIMNMMNITELLTYFNWGTNATLLRGEITQFDQIPVLFTDHIVNYLSPTGVYTGAAPNTGTQNRTGILCVNTDGLLIGNRRQIQIESQTMPLSDMLYILGTWRGDVQPTFTSGQTWVSYLYNVAQ